jgi:hypothetical protein
VFIYFIRIILNGYRKQYSPLRKTYRLRRSPCLRHRSPISGVLPPTLSNHYPSLSPPTSPYHSQGRGKRFTYLTDDSYQVHVNYDGCVSVDLRVPGVRVGQVQVQPAGAARCEPRDGHRTPEQTLLHYANLLLIQ